MENPYQPGAYGGSHPTSTGQISTGVIQALNGTRPWVRLCSIMGFIGAGFMIVCGFIMITGGAIGGMNKSAPEGLGTVQMIGGLVYIVLSLMYLFPSLKLWKYGTAILHLMSSQSATDLERALDEQRGFWKFVGIMVLISLAMMVISIVVAVIVGIASAAAMSR